MKPCEQCKTPFVPLRKTARFCSDACKHAAARDVPLIPFDQAEAQLILDVIDEVKKKILEAKVAGNRKRVEIGMKMLNEETSRYAFYRQLAIDSMTDPTVDTSQPFRHTNP